MTVRDIRAINQLSVGTQLLHDYAAIQCDTCRWQYTADLARYWSPSDLEVFACPHCDHSRMGLLFGKQDPSDPLPLAQRFAAVTA